MGLHLWERGTGDRLETVKQILSHILTLDDKSVLCDQGLKSFNNRSNVGGTEDRNKGDLRMTGLLNSDSYQSLHNNLSCVIIIGKTGA